MLSYSEGSDGGYRVTCILSNERSQNYGQLVNLPNLNLKRATLREHSGQVNHRSAVKDTAVFLGHSGVAISEKYSPKRQQLLEEKIRELENVNQFKPL